MSKRSLWNGHAPAGRITKTVVRDKSEFKPMNKIFITVATSVLAVALPGVAHAQSTASASASGSTTIVRPITITKTADMAFGTIVKPSSGTATIQLPSSGDTVSATGGAAAVSGGTLSRAKFAIGGEGGQAVSISVPASFNMSMGSDTIAVTLTPDLAASVNLSNAAGSSGSATLNVGGQFSLPSTQATGVYSGSFTVTVAYQ